MTWLEFKNIVKSRARTDSLSHVEMDSVEHGSPFSEEVWRLLQKFFIASKERYVPIATLTLATSDQEIDLSDEDKCDAPIFYAGKLWLATREIDCYDFAALQEEFAQNDLTAGSPRGWAMMDEFKLFLDRPLDAATAAASGHRINGFAVHSPLTSGSEDASTLLLNSMSVDAAAEYIVVNLGRPVAHLDTELNRLSSYNSYAAEWIQKRAAKQMTRIVMAERLR
jgi:hypothetical protein